MLTVTLTIIAIVVACGIVWFAVRRSKAVQRVSGHLSGPVAQMQEQILLTADSAVDRLDGKIAQMEILLSEIDRRSNLLAQQSKQQQLQQLQLEQLQQQLVAWVQTQRQQLEKDFDLRQQMLTQLQAKPPMQTYMQQLSQVTPNTTPMAVFEPQLVGGVQQERTEPVQPVRKKPERTSSKAIVNEISAPPQDKRSAILDMAEQGFSVTDIAQKMGIGKGEVMLLLKLRKKAVP